MSGEDRICQYCGRPLNGRQTKYCSRQHQRLHQVARDSWRNYLEARARLSEALARKKPGPDPAGAEWIDELFDVCANALAKVKNNYGL